MKQRNSTRGKRFLVVFVALVAVLVVSWQADLHPPTSAFLNRLMRSDIYDTISDGREIALWEKGATARASFNVKFANEYALVLRFQDKYPPLFFRPRGVLEIEYYQGDRLVRRTRYENHAPPSPDSSGKCQEYALDVVLLPQHPGLRSHSVVVRVVEPDEGLAAYKGHMRLVVRGSPYW
jgi:hypothetical protein